MNIKTIVLGALLSVPALLLGVNPASANTFVESDTNANLVGGGDDSVLTVVRVGKQSGELSYGIGAGYDSNGDEAVVNGLFEYSTRISNSVVLGAEVEVNYGLDSDVLQVAPELRVRKYF